MANTSSSHNYYFLISFSISLFLLQHQVLMMAAEAAGGKVPALIVFGDSSVDTGNNNVISTILKSNFRPYGRDFYVNGRPTATGRFCNGRIPPDFISEAFKIKKFVPAYLDPSYNITDFATGVCFASAGSGYDNATSDVLNVIPLWKELQYYKEYQSRLRSYMGEAKANHTLTEAMYLISLGTNDFLENYYTMQDRKSQYSVGQFMDFLVGIARNFVTDLYSLGALKISLGGLPPMGCLPLERATNFMERNECNEEYNDVASKFNVKLKGVVVQLNKELPGVRLVFSNPYLTLMRIIKRPSLYGFEETSMACCATGRFEMGYMCNEFNLFTCTNANKYVFWDSFHPSEKTNQIIAEHVIQKFLRPFL